MSQGAQIKETLARVLRLLQQSENVSFAEVLAMTASAFNGEVVTYWMIDEKNQVLREARSWFSPMIASGDRLRADTAKRSFACGEGMPGSVWKTKRPFLSRDLQMDMSLPRSIDAYNAGLRCGFWFPVLTGESVSGVVEVLAKDFSIEQSDLDEAFSGSCASSGTNT